MKHFSLIKTMSYTIVAVLLLAGCSVAPHGKTIVLERPASSPTAKPAPSGALSFQLERASTVPLDKLDQAGYFGGRLSSLVCGWLDNDHLAAVGTKLNAAPNETGDAAGVPLPAMEEKKRISILRAEGVTGQVLSVDWQTGEAVELHTVRDAVVTAMGLDGDRERLWYTTINNSGILRLSVSDVSFTHELLDVPDFMGSQPFWSSHDKYLGYLSKMSLELFDGTSTLSVPTKGMRLYYSDNMYIDDSTDRILFLADEHVLVTMTLPTDQQPGMDLEDKAKLPSAIPEEVLFGKTKKMQWVDSEYLAYLTYDKKGQALQVVSTAEGGGSASFEGVSNFAFSDDRKYICLAREADGGMANVFVGEWQDGAIVNEKLVFAGFSAVGGIFFSPDNSKLYLEGSYRLTDDSRMVGLVLKFR